MARHFRKRRPPVTTLQTVATTQDPRVIETAVISCVLLLSKIWDRIYGRRKDSERKIDVLRARDDLTKRLDDHAKSDADSFGKIDKSLALLDQTLKEAIAPTIHELKMDVKGLREDVTGLMTAEEIRARKENH